LPPLDGNIFKHHPQWLGSCSFTFRGRLAGTALDDWYALVAAGYMTPLLPPMLARIEWGTIAAAACADDGVDTKSSPI